MRRDDETELVTLANGLSYHFQVAHFVLKDKDLPEKGAQIRMMRDSCKGVKEHGPGQQMDLLEMSNLKKAKAGSLSYDNSKLSFVFLN